MATATELADLEEVLRSAHDGRPAAPDVVRRVEEWASKVKEETRRRGITDLAVPLIRQARDE
ncbi:MAG TPA: hypothetical protein VIK18_09550 [Pirellulales bacterium]